MTTSSGEVPFAIDGQALSSVEKASESVGGPIGVEAILLVAGLAVVAVGVLGILTYLYTARDTVEREIDEVSAERDAFLEFADRVSEMAFEQSASAVATPQSIQTLEPGGPPVRKVANAFEDTVMAVPHYTDTYGDDVLAQMAIELDGDLVASLNRPGSLSETAKQGLQRQATDAASKREDLLDILQEEREALDRAETQFDGVVEDLHSMNDRPLGELSYSSLQHRHGALETARQQVADVAAERQRTIRSHIRTLSWNREDVTLQEYLYGGADQRYPVLNTVARLDRLIEGAQRRVRRAVWSRA